MHVRLSRGALIAVALAACTVGSACDDSPPTAPSTGGPTQESAAASVATSSPAATPPAASFPADADWKALAYPPAQCMTRDEYSLDAVGPEGWDAATVATTSADVTGDDVPEMLVLLSCPVPTSSLAQELVVFRAAAGGPEVIGVLPDDVAFLGATVTTGDHTVTLEGPSRADGDPMCCAGHYATTTYRWTGDTFEVADRMEALTTQPFGHDPLPDGEYVGLLNGFDDHEVLMDVVQWFDGAAAQQACDEDGNYSPDSPVAGCVEYYVRNDNDLMRVLPVEPGASIGYLDWNTFRSVPVPDPTGIQAQVEKVPYYLGGAYYRFTVAGGAVTRMQEFFVS